MRREYRLEGATDQDCADRFAERVADYRAEIHRLAEDDIPAAIANVTGERRLVVPDGLPDEWTRGLATIRDDPPLTTAQLDSVDGVLTTCALAIAETGTIVLDAGPGQGRRALTLVPDLHVCVVRREQVVSQVPDAIARLDPARPLTWISGPSATSDIELNRVEGVHGPRNLVVLLIG